MNPLEIILIIIGIIVIIISCILVDKSQNKTLPVSGINQSVENIITQEEKLKLKEKIEEVLSEASEEVIIRADDTLSKISNEKIMAVNEFSDQIFEKINRNHEEVVFLYNMLNDKEKELKSAVREIDVSKKKVKEILEVKNNASTQEAKKEKNQAANKTTVQVDQTQRPVKPAQNSENELKNADIQALNNAAVNNNAQILALYSKGKSIMEISKLLDLGQGEVKLVIDLFKGKK